MPNIRWVTPTQVAAAKLVVKIDLEDGKEPDPLALKISQATPMRRPKEPVQEPGEDATTATPTPGRADDA